MFVHGCSYVCVIVCMFVRVSVCTIGIISVHCWYVVVGMCEIISEKLLHLTYLSGFRIISSAVRFIHVRRVVCKS